MRAVVLSAVAAVALLVIPATGEPAGIGRPLVSASVAPASGGARITVAIRVARRFTAATRPRAVTVVFKGRAYKLRHVAGTAVAAGATSRWRSAAAKPLSGAVGKRVVVRVRTGAGSHSYATTAKQEAPTTPGGTQTTTTPGAPTTTTTTPVTTTTTTTTTATTPTPADPRTRFLAMFQNSGWDRPYTANTPQHEPMEDLYNFCANGTYRERFTNGFTGNDTFYQGTWQLQGDPQTGTVGGYDVVEGVVVTTDQSAQQSTLYVDLSEQLPNTAYINQQEYMRQAPQAC